MKRTPLGRVLPSAFFLVSFSFASIPLPSSPSWTSLDNDYSTGGAYADIDQDGFLDLCISNGNDMNTDYNSAYMNSLGALEAVASWRSVDAGYFGHCYSGDVDNDGYPDLAVAYLGSGSSGEFKVRIYRNIGGVLETAPSWKAADEHSSFDCCLGDVDLDGDLDLCISAGDAYAGETDSVRIYRNNAGQFDTLPFWTAHDGTASDAVRFCDVDDDGDLDLFVGQRRKVTMYRNNAGTLDPDPAWVVTSGVGWVLRLAIGDYDRDHFPDLAVACNDQLGDPNSIRIYRNRSGTLDTVPVFVAQRQGANLYSSCVAFGDFNADMQPDLAAGGWWRPAVVYENRSGVLDTIPSWSWSPPNRQDLVCEALVVADFRNTLLIPVPEQRTADGTRRLWQLGNMPLQSLDSVTVDGVRVPVAGYCHDPVAGWVSLAATPPNGATIVFHYQLSAYPDLAVTNWDPSHGNHLFLNTNGSAVSSRSSSAIRPSPFVIYPNPVRSTAVLRFAPLPLHPSAPLRLFDASGRLVRSFIPHSSLLTLDLSSFPPGLYFAALGNGPRQKLVKTGR